MNQGMPGRNGPGMNGGPNADNGKPDTEDPELSPEEVDAARTREVTTKAMSGILVLLLKWLRLSREYYLQVEVNHRLMLNRCFTIRVLYSAVVGLQLCSAGAQAIRPPGCTTGYRQQNGSTREQVCLIIS